MTVTKILIILLQWIVGGPLLAFIGLPFLISSTNILLQNNLSEEDKSDAWIGFVIGASSTACGGWLALNAWQKIKAQEDEDAMNTMLELDLIFMEQIQSNQGNISSINFATAAKVPIELAHVYLNEKSKEIECQLNVDEDGAVLYHFTLPRSMM
jgi:type III secretory pathway component EscV